MTTPTAHPTGLHRLLLGVALALLVSRPLLPSEAVAWRGDGQVWALAWLTLLAASTACRAWEAARGVARQAMSGRSRWVDWLALALLALLGLSVVRGGLAGEIELRPAISMAFEFAGMLAAFAVLRQRLASGAETRAVMAAMAGAALLLALMGLYQYAVTMPATRAHYYADPDRALREAGQWYPAGSIERFMFEQRLDSREPMATFALTNSLAGFLIPWLVVIAGVVLMSGTAAFDAAVGKQLHAPSVGSASRPATRGNKPARRDREPATAAGIAAWGLHPRWCAAAVGIPIIACLLLTKSRSGYLGAGLGLGLVILHLPAFERLRQGPVIAAGIAVKLVITAALALHGGLDWLVLTEAPKSLGYRWEYWQATLAMIGQRPGLGWGLGNFGDAYLAFKLPQSSEEISDPHNFVLEIAATAGVPACLAFLALLAIVLFARPRKSTAGAPVVAAPSWATSPPKTSEMSPRELAANSPWHVLAGALGGLLFALVVAPSQGVEPSLGWTVIGGAAIFGVFWGLRRWIVGGAIDPMLPKAAAAALLLNLLAAGGIGFPGVATSLWAMLALALASVELLDNAAPRDSTAPKSARDRNAGAPRARRLTVATAGALAAALGCATTSYLPVEGARRQLAAAATARDARAASEHAQQAARIDHLSAEPCRALANLSLQRWQASPDPRMAESVRAAQDDAIARRPRSSTVRLEAGDRLLAIFEKSHQPEDLEAAIARYREAIDRYPHSAARRARLAHALNLAGDADAARAAAAEALAASDATTHVEHQLWGPVRDEMLRLRGAEPGE